MMTVTQKVQRKFRQAQLLAYRRLGSTVTRSDFQNVYYCCTQKTASQWFKAVLSDPLLYRHAGLTVVPHPPGPRSEVEAGFAQPFPSRTIATHLYIDFATYDKIPKPASFRTFFVLRDPRDIVVSWYFSTLYSHHPYPKVIERRRVLESMNMSDGLRFSIDELNREGLFNIQRSWMSHCGHPDVNIFRYENFAVDNLRFLNNLLRFLSIELTDKSFIKLANRHMFTKYSGNRIQGVQNQYSHYRKGIPGDWVNYFDDDVRAHFSSTLGDLLDVLRYAPCDQVAVQKSADYGMHP